MRHAAVGDRSVFEALVLQSPRPVLITNNRAEIEFVNTAWERQFGYRLTEIRGKNPRILQSGKTPRSVYRRTWRALRSGKVFRSDEVIDRRKKGSLFHVDTTTFPLHVGRSLLYVQILDDVTRRKRHEKYRELFIDVAAHDIRSPIGNLQLISELLRLDTADPEKTLQSMREEIERLKGLVTVLLDPSLFKAGTLKLHKTSIELVGELQKAIQAAQLRSPKQRIRLRAPASIHIARRTRTPISS